jgi:hypothetical protein
VVLALKRKFVGPKLPGDSKSAVAAAVLSVASMINEERRSAITGGVEVSLHRPLR